MHRELLQFMLLLMVYNIHYSDDSIKFNTTLHVVQYVSYSVHKAEAMIEGMYLQCGRTTLETQESLHMR